MEIKESWKTKGYIDEPLQEGMDVRYEIEKLCKEKKAIILAHYYTQGDIQDVAHFVGDSLALARQAANTDARIIVMCGVHFMAETCKLLSPDKLVLCPDLNAGCSLADSCKAEDEGYPAPKVTLDPTVTDFYRFTKDSFKVENYQYHPFDFEIPMAI